MLDYKTNHLLPFNCPHYNDLICGVEEVVVLDAAGVGPHVDEDARGPELSTTYYGDSSKKLDSFIVENNFAYL